MNRHPLPLPAVRPAVATLALLALGLLALPPAAGSEAKPKPKQLKQARFQLIVTGQQVTTWKYVKQQQQPSCDWPEEENGSQVIDFETPKSRKHRTFVTATRTPGGGFELEGQGDVLVLAEGDLERRYDRRYSQISDCGDDVPPIGGDGPPVDARGTAKCFQLGGLHLHLGDSRRSLYDNPSNPMPKVGAKAGGSSLFLRADPYWGLLKGDDPSLPASCEAQGEGDADIGIVESRGEWAGGLIEAAEPLSAARLFDRRRKAITLHFGETVDYPNKAQAYVGAPKTTGRTVMSAKVVLKRR